MVYPLIFGVFGLIVGSFLNVLILRWKEKPLTGRSVCASCEKTISWYDLIPVFSWLLLGGRCRECKSPISIQYPLVESATALTFFLIALSPLPLSSHVMALPIAALLIAIAVYDLYHSIIPDVWVFTLAALSFLASAPLFYFSETFFQDFAWIMLTGPVSALPIFFLWFVSRGTWMGFGDVKLAVAMGWLLGAIQGFVAVMFAFVLGALVSVPLLFFSSQTWRRLWTRITPTVVSLADSHAYTMKSEIPFGPYLVAATFILWLSNMHGIDLIDMWQQMVHQAGDLLL